MKKNGFTLIELLVVIGLMAILITVLVGAVGHVIGTARDKATRATIKKTNALLRQRSQGFERWIHRQHKRAGITLSDLDVNLQAIELKKTSFRHQFPQLFSDDDTTNSGDYDFPVDDSNFIPSNHRPETESAECLYYFLTQAENFGAPPIGTDAFSSGEIADTDNDGLPEIVDSWGNPLRFYRWPTRMIRPQPFGKVAQPDANPQLPIQRSQMMKYLTRSLPEFIGNNQNNNQDPLAIDPDDPIGLTDVRPPTAFEKKFHNRHTWHYPLIVSAGPDGYLGIYEPNDKANFGHLAQLIPDDPGTKDDESEPVFDNITNFNYRP